MADLLGQCAHQERLIDEQRAQMTELIARVGQSVVALQERDLDVERTFSVLERRLNRHRVDLDRVEELVSPKQSECLILEPNNLPIA